MEQARQLHDKYFVVADKALSNIPAANCFQQKTGVQKVYGAAGIAGLLLTLVFFNIGAPLLVNLTGFGYAAYASIAAIESPGKEDDAQWLTYWVIFALCNVAEYFTGFLLYWIPFYYVFKLGFLAWLMLPTTRGAEKLYFGTVRPFVLAKTPIGGAPSQRSAPNNRKSE
ncbi:ER membrane protein DP1/Yop1 [Dipsacomyces acuminosporus]|nr:ER membrane protein DP1/Yop1 [Dipsacomyces acuminosporus]